MTENDTHGVNGNIRLLLKNLNEISAWLRKADEEETRKQKWIVIFHRIDITFLIIFELINLANIVATLVIR